MVGPTPRMVLEGYPTLFVIDRWGTVRSKQWGTGGLVDSVNQVVYGKPKPPAEEPPSGGTLETGVEAPGTPVKRREIARQHAAQQPPA